MPRTKGKKKKAGAPPRPEPAEGGEPRRAGLPAPESIIGVDTMVRGGVVYRILKTNEVDGYEEKPARRRARKRREGK